MRSRTPIAAAVGLALLVWVFVLWMLGGDSGTPETSVASKPAGAELSLLKNRPLPARPAGAEAPPAPPEAAPPAVESGEAAEKGARAERRRRDDEWRPARPAARDDEDLTAAEARATEAEIEVEDQLTEGGGGTAPEPPPTAIPGSIYDGLSQDEMVELLVAMKRLRDAGVFVKLTPEQFYDVQKLLGDVQGVQDADRITREILGMSAGEWLDHERGPRGRFVLR
jgi:hypothetical protein